MNNIRKLLISLCGLFILMSCIEENFPTNIITSEQIEKSNSALESLANATASFMNAYEATTVNINDYGYGSMMIIRDVFTHDVPAYSITYDYYNTPWSNLNGLGNNEYTLMIWAYYYKLIQNAHSIIGIVDPETATETALNYLGVALGFRALAYLDLTRMFEYRKTGVGALDSEAESNSIYGLTVPIVVPGMEDAELKNNPRAPFYEMYRFILTDLNRAETYLANYTRKDKSHPDLSVIYGLKARFWLEVATRFNQSGEDLSTALSHDNDPESEHLDKLGIQTVADCYSKAASYAQQAIAAGGYQPLTRDQWHHATEGFNKSTNSSWMFAIVISENVVYGTYKSFLGNICAETDYGVSNSQYGALRMIGRSLYDQIPDADWRKTTWVDPADAGGTPGDKYVTLLDDETWAKTPSYTAFKYRPNQGAKSDYKVGNAIHIPLMRMEEMVFIEAEALAYANGLSAGVNALENFMNTYRYTDGSYTCQPLSGTDEFVDKLLTQKRIELWLEGLVFFDFKRLNKQVIKGYTGTNFPEQHRYNSLPGYVAPWMNLYINDSEFNVNQAIKPNPDPTRPVAIWTE